MFLLEILNTSLNWTVKKVLSMITILIAIYTILYSLYNVNSYNYK